MTNQATYGIAITADDKTAKGVKSAEKRIGLIPKHTSAINKRSAQQDEQLLDRRSRGAIRTFGKVEQAAARAFGGRSLTSGFSTRLSAIKDAAAAAGEGMGEAATAGGALEGAMGAVGIAAGATIGVLTAAGYAAYKLADGWAKGAASIGRTADIIGVASQQLQEFNAAAERQGVDKGTATSAAAGLSQSLNDAKYGKNNDVIALLSKLGIKLQLNADGTVNTGAMLPVIADAFAKQNSSGRRTMAHMLGISDAAIPAFSQGGAALRADMSDAEKTAYVASGGDIARAKRIQRKQAIVGQMKDRVIGLAGSATADAGEPALDAAISAGTGALAGASTFSGVVRNSFAPAADKIDRAANKMRDAVASMFGGTAARGSDAAFVRAIESRGERSRDGQVSPKGARGRMQVMPYTAHHPGMGIRPAADESTAEYNRVGEEYAAALLHKYDGDWALASAAYNAGPGRVDRWVKKFGDPRRGGITDAEWIAQIPGHGRGTYEETRRYAERVTAGQTAEVPVRVEVHLVNAPAGTKAKVTAGASSPPAVSHAMQN